MEHGGRAAQEDVTMQQERVASHSKEDATTYQEQVSPKPTPSVPKCPLNPPQVSPSVP